MLEIHKTKDTGIGIKIPEVIKGAALPQGWKVVKDAANRVIISHPDQELLVKQYETPEAAYVLQLSYDQIRYAVETAGFPLIFPFAHEGQSLIYDLYHVTNAFKQVGPQEDLQQLLNPPDRPTYEGRFRPLVPFDRYLEVLECEEPPHTLFTDPFQDDKQGIASGIREAIQQGLLNDTNTLL